MFRTPEAPSDAKLGDVWVNPKDGVEMVYVPAGEFVMGSADSDKNAEAGEKPQFRVSLPGYWIDKFEVTVAQYRKFCQETGREMPDAPVWGWQGSHPVVNVAWDEAAAYAKWAGERLPMEMEWEKAARGTDGRIYPWGDEWEASRCANKTNSSDGPTPVGSYPSGASPYGVLDMAGNVWEWCADWYDADAYQRYAKGDLKPPVSGGQKVLRSGSSAGGKPAFLRCARRLSCSRGLAVSGFGFRCVRGLP